MRRIHHCRPGWEQPLLEELQRTHPASSHFRLSEGFVGSELSDEDSARPAAVAFAEQVLPDAHELSVGAIPDWPALLREKITGALNGVQSPWRLHVFGVEGTGNADTQGLARQVDRDLSAVMRDALRGQVTDFQECWKPDELLVQVAFTAPRKVLLSVCTAEQRTVLRRTLSRFPAGRAPLKESQEPPSRAFLKLVEAEMQLGRPLRQGETAVDLGACPGGWSWVALRRGLEVTAVDRSPLREDLMAHPRLTFIRGDAFSFKPEKPVDWLLCDVIAFPDRTLAMLRTWLSARLCRRLVVTVKFKGSEDYPVLEDLKKLLKSNTRAFSIRHLQHNKNEVTVIAERAEPEGCLG